MKKTLKGLAICGLILAAAPTAFAATELAPGIETEADVKFQVDPNPETEIVVPNEKEEEPEVIELPGGGNSGSGSIRVEFVPHLRFGISTNMTAGAETIPANTVKYNFKGDTVKHDIAPFVQVRDSRGKSGADAKWTLVVEATPFTAKNAKGPGQDDVLTNVEIELGGSTLTMDYGDTAKANTLVNGQATDAVNNKLKTNGDKMLIMETKSNQSTSGHRVSNVFDSSYVKGKTYANNKAPEVKFIKAKGQAPMADVSYKSTLTWTIQDVL